MKKELFWAALTTILLALLVYHFITVESLKLNVFSKNWEISDLETDNYIVGEIASKRIYKRSEIDTFLIKNYYPSDGYEHNGDTIFLFRTYIVFDKDSLVKFEPISYKEK